MRITSRHVELAAGHVEQRRRVVHDLVEGEQAEVDRHDLDDGAHPAQRGADAGSDEGRLRQRRVADPLGPELLEQAQADRVAAAVAPDVLAHEEDSVVAGQRFAERLAHRLAVGDGAHGVSPLRSGSEMTNRSEVRRPLERAGIGEGDGVVDLGVDLALRSGRDRPRRGLPVGVERSRLRAGIGSRSFHRSISALSR